MPVSNRTQDLIPDDTTFLQGDLTSQATIDEVVIANIDTVLHCVAADKYVNSDEHS
ncbi:hypothetical protein [Natrinema sp. SYSU A 869]|uniref:hypothetical protein n=1 Tax=Natrinema sp. SYSU A 869 TaxID=2871694 RepID=UPI001CA3A139|nr:hypothetical protein [Natrinema sp. SYSU A 869]